MRSRYGTLALWVFSLTIFVNSYLLFLVQPMFARMVLPLFGGSPAVWNTTLVFYQAVLLLGYAYAHVSTAWLGIKRQPLLHLGLLLLAALVLPVRVPASWHHPVEGSPVSWLLALLSVAVGLPFFAVSAGSPLLQKWYAATGHRFAADPYFLYAGSNLGSMLALVSYPVLIEPALKLKLQGWCWAAGYVLLLALTGLCALLVRRSQKISADSLSIELLQDDVAGAGLADQRVRCPKSSDRVSEGLDTAETKSAPITMRRRFHWVILALAPSSLMLSVTTYLTADIASVPLLWVIPLAIYLLTFILVFAARPPLRREWMAKAMPIVLMPLVIVLATRSTGPIILVMPLHLAAFFVIAMVCHGELAQDRPPVANLTEFYLFTSIGGVLGGVFSALLAPVIFSGIAEYPIMLTIVCLLLPWRSAEPWRSRARMWDLALPAALGLLTVALFLATGSIRSKSSIVAGAIAFGVPAVICFSFSRRPLRFSLAVGVIFLAAACTVGEYNPNSGDKVLHAERSFFGAIKVIDDTSDRYHLIMHGSTLHGGQSMEPARQREPILYYHRSGPLGQYFKAAGDSIALRNVAVIGLGAGGTSCYARAGQHWTYYEIDPHVERIARNPSYFTYLRDCPAELRVILGDGRLTLSAAPDGAYDLLILDAYSSDSVPVHLMTREALQLYLKKLSPNGVLVFHISNRYLDLEPVLGNLAREAGLFCMAQSDLMLSPVDREAGKLPSVYVMMARNKADLHALSSDPRWKEPRRREDLGIWTDDYSSILKVLRWRIQH